MALRNLFRYFRRTLLTMLSISVGLAILLWLQCLIAGRNENMIQKITSTYTGHIQVLSREYRKNHLPTKFFTAPAHFDLGVPGSFARRVHLPTLISTGEESIPVMFEGIEPQKESEITKLKSSLKTGEYLSDGTDENCTGKEIYIGQSLAELLQVEVGSKIVALAQANDGTLGNELFRVKGIFATGSPDFDKSYVFSQIGCIQKMGAIGGIHEIVAHLNDSQDENKAKDHIATLIPEDLEQTTWREALPSVATMITYNEASFRMITFILFTVIVLGVINTLLMNIFERTKEFGVMLALGTSAFQLRALIVFESLFIGVIASAAGIILGVTMVFYHIRRGFDLSPFFGNQTGTDGFAFDLIIHPIFEIVPFLRLVGIVLIFVTLAGLYPAYRASKLNPIEVMRS